MPRRTVLFVCTHNSARSQLAEALLRERHGDRYDSFSAGTEATRVKPEVVTVLAEIGVDATGQRSKTVESFDGRAFDYVVTVCGHAHETCPNFAGEAKIVHVGFDDPPRLAADEIDPEKALNHYRRVRDEIRAFVENLPKALY